MDYHIDWYNHAQFADIRSFILLALSERADIRRERDNELKGGEREHPA